MSKTSFLNIFFRGLTLLSKFLFIVFIGKYSVDEVNLGIFGIISTTLVLLIYLIGFDFYVFNAREIIGSKEHYINKVRDQLLFHLAGYVLIVPLSLFIVVQMGFIPMEYMWVFMLLLISEHLGQEFYRLFTTLESSVKANIMLFIRSGLWIWIVFVDFFVFQNKIDLMKYITYWTFFSWLSVFIFGALLSKKVGIVKDEFRPPNFKWIMNGIRVAGVFFLSSLSFQVIQLSDRFLIDFFYGKKLVGVYTAYSQFTNAIEVFTFSAITMVIYPKMIKFSGEFEKYNTLKKVFLKQLLVTSLFFIVIFLVFGPIILKVFDKRDIVEHIYVFYILLGGVFFLIISNVFHYDLYIKNRDKEILWISLAGMFLNVVLNFLLIPKYDIFGAALATLSSFLLIFIFKLLRSRNEIKMK